MKTYKDFILDGKYISDYAVTINYPEKVTVKKIVQDIEEYGYLLGTIAWDIWKFRVIIRFWEVDKRIIGKDIYIIRTDGNTEEKWYQFRDFSKEDYENLPEDALEEIQKITEAIQNILNQEIIKEELKKDVKENA